MDLDIKRMIDLHKIDQQIIEIHEGKGDLPNIIEEQENKINELKNQISDGQMKLELLNKDINQYNIETEDLKSQIDKHNSQIYSVKSNKEYEAILKEIDYLKAKDNENITSLKNATGEKDSINSNIEEDQNKIEELVLKLDENKKELKKLQH